MTSRQFKSNAIWTVIQIGINSASLFFVFKFLLGSIGAEKIGIWSIVMALSNFARMSDLGFGGGVTKYVAEYKAKNSLSAIQEVVETGFSTILVLCGLLTPIIYIAGILFFPSIFSNANELNEAFMLLPYSVLSFSAITLSSIFTSALDGINRSDVRNILLTISTFLYSISIPFFIGRFDLIGLGYLQLVQSVVFLIASYFVFQKFSFIDGIRIFSWKRARFKEMIRFTANIQITSFASILCEPATKILLGRFGDPSMVGFYEMASRMINQFRSILVNLNQILIPKIVELHQSSMLTAINYYKKIFRINFSISLGFYAAMIILLPVVSIIWIGDINSDFIIFSTMLLFSMCINSLTSPAYFSNIGTGSVYQNTLAQVFMAAVNIILGVFGGMYFGGFGVIAGFGFAILVASTYQICAFANKNTIYFKDHFGKKDLKFALNIVIIIITYGLLCGYRRLNNNEFMVVAFALLAILLLLAIPFYYSLFDKKLNTS